MNARQEFINHFQKVQEINKEIKITSAIIIDSKITSGIIIGRKGLQKSLIKFSSSCKNSSLIFVLYPNYSEDEYNKFLEEINLFIYDSGFGEQELYGYIWYNDGTWSERAEYDGSEWWEYKKCPSFQDKLNEFKLNNKND